MRRTTVDFGIDLGTTNSAVCVAGSEWSLVVPSVVNADGEGALTVGREARRVLELDPENTHAEFKRLMGTTSKLAFAAAALERTPEELSAAVLRVLVEAAGVETGEAIDAAVITVPALFEIPQNEATERAAALAGIGFAPLLQEPIAAALAYGCGRGAVSRSFWLVYDFGGGTFDASIVSVRDGRLAVVDHDGDNFLGGKDLDKRLLEHLLAGLKEEHALPALEAGHPDRRRVMATLRAVAERTRIDLSEARDVEVHVPELTVDDAGRPVDLATTVRRLELERLIRPEVARSIDICDRLLHRNRLAPVDVAKLVLVGGVTQTPLIREALVERLGIELECELDPATTVARGAAIHASSIRRPAASVAEERARPGVRPVRIEVPAVSQDEAPYLVGRFLESPEARPAWVRLSRGDGGWQSDRLKVSDQGAFMCQLQLVQGEKSRFDLEAWTAEEVAIAVEPDHVEVSHGLSVAAPPLSRTLGVGLVDNSVHVYLGKGTSLPAKATHLHRTTTALEPGKPGAVIDVPVVQGESERADRNRHIGTLCIPATRIRRALPLAAEVEVTVEVDASSTVRARAYVPFLDQVFEQVLSTRLVPATSEELERELELAFRRREKLEETAEGEVLSRELGDSLFDEIIRDIAAASLGDEDAALRAQRRLLELHERLDHAEEEARWPREVARAHWARSSATEAVEEQGEAADRELLRKLVKEVGVAVAARDLRGVERKASALFRLRHRVLARRPEYWIDLFWWLERRRDSMTDRARADRLISEGRSALERQDHAALERVVVDLDGLLAPEDREQPLGMSSHVR